MTLMRMEMKNSDFSLLNDLNLQSFSVILGGGLNQGTVRSTTKNLSIKSMIYPLAFRIACISMSWRVNKLSRL